MLERTQRLLDDFVEEAKLVSDGRCARFGKGGGPHGVTEVPDPRTGEEGAGGHAK